MPSGKHRALYRTPDGKTRSAGSFNHKRAAQNAAAVAEAESRTLGWRDPKAAARSWGDWCDAWWPTRSVSPGTLKRDASPRDKYLKERWGDVALIDITRHDIKAWASKLAREGLAPASVQRYLHLFSGSLTAAVDAEILQVNPAYRLALPGGETDVMRFLTADEVGKVLDAARDPLVSLLFGTGLRWGEGAGLHAKRVALDRGTLRVAEVWDNRTRSMVPYPKGRRIRNVPIPDWVAEGIEPLMGGSATVPLFGFLDIDNWRKRVWEPAIKAAGLEDVRIHDARHTYASVALQGGITLAEVGKLLGHESPTTTQRYAHLAAIPNERVLAAMPDPRKPKV